MSDRTMLCPRCWGGQYDPVRGPENTWAYGTSQCAYCGGHGHVPDTRMSEHFWLSDCLRSQTAVRNKIPNEPVDATITEHLQETLDTLGETVYRLHPFKISSGYRCIWLNRKLNSKDSSAHVVGWALDMEPLDGHRREMMGKCIAAGIPHDQFIYEGVWIHGGLYNQNHLQRHEALMAFGGKYPPYNASDPRVV